MRYRFRRTVLSNLLIPELVLPQDQHVRLSNVHRTYINSTELGKVSMGIEIAHVLEMFSLKATLRLPMKPKRTWKERILQEVKNLAAVLIYLWVFLTVFELHQAIVLSEHNIQYNYAEGLVFALVNAWILAKFVVIGEGLGIGKRWHSKPLWQSILLKSAIFSVILMACHLVEEALTRMWGAKSFAAGFPALDVKAVIDGLTLTLIVFIVLIPFFTAREFRRILGKDVLQAALLRREA